MSQADLDTVLDLNTLQQYCNAIGATTLLKSVVLFEQLLPEYVGNLIQAQEASDKETLCAEAHKFKGAAGSVGMKRVQQFAQLLQHGESEQWSELHCVWLSNIVEFSAKDLASLKAYLESQA
ncbi:histidine kinase [Shewanella sp. SNU WT4]|uniref:Hpt domain-containing protein n=1 Tax=Shewanella sp. SNU WT4 TaxID=2590015 RepID=UPI001129253D|nr:Hpt domain-containing protein [Shewanella sp. SNU WT4]QDF66295.1 histidine kinase [Shewanella sp. SNU WT4]